MPPRTWIGSRLTKLSLCFALPIGPVRRCMGWSSVSTNSGRLEGDLQPLLLEAGFARRDAEYLPLAIESLARLASRIGW